MLAMVALGVGEMLGGQLIGQIIDAKGSKQASLWNTLIVTVMGVATVAFLVVNQYNWLAFLMAFLWGFQDSATNTHSQEMLGFEFDEPVPNESVAHYIRQTPSDQHGPHHTAHQSSADPFAAFYFVQSMACCVFQLAQSLILTHQQLMVYSSVVVSIGVASMLAIYFKFPFSLRE